MKLASDSKIKGDLGGVISVTFKPDVSFVEFCAKHIENYNPDRFEMMAIRGLYGKESSVTVYAIDNNHLETSELPKNKIPVKKFKINSSFIKEMLPLIAECNFTLNTGNYDLSDMEVINK